MLLNPPVRVAIVEPAEPTAVGKTNMYSVSVGTPGQGEVR